MTKPATPRQSRRPSAARATRCSWTRAGLVDVDPATGKVRFQFPWRSRSHASVNAAAPVVVGNLVFLSASYGTGATLLQIDGRQREASSGRPMMRSRTITRPAFTATAICTAITAARSSARACGAIELKTGKVQWNVDGFGAGTVTLAGDRLLLIRENGELVVAPASPKEFQPRGPCAVAARDRAILSGPGRWKTLRAE